MANKDKGSNLTHPPGAPQLPAGPHKPGSTLLALAQLALEKSKKAGRQVVEAGSRAARAAGHAAKQVGPENPVDILIEESAAITSHASAHAVHRRFGGAAVGVKAGVELLALVIAKVKRAKPRVMRGLRSSLRGTIHHALGAGLHHGWPIAPDARGTKTSGAANDTDIGEAAEEEDPSRTDY